ncbi:MAG: GspE/PulE family protein [Cyanobacteriota bacterium]|nr:GspE/PulE family protein [Cyanobacteriota bacterium]
MTLSIARPVPPPSSSMQRRLEVELLLGERVATPEELTRAAEALSEDDGGIGSERWQRLGVLPLSRDSEGLLIAVPSHWGQPERAELLETLKEEVGSCRLQRALPEELSQALLLTPQAPAAEEPQLRSLMEGLNLPTEAESPVTAQLDDLEAPTGTHTSPVVSVVDRLLVEALRSGASDIHIEPQENGLEVRFRVDGLLQKLDEQLPRAMAPALISRLKIMADLDIAEKRLPQDGRIRRHYRGRQMDFRVSTLPTRHGEKVVLRLLDSGSTQLGLDSLVTDPAARQILRAVGSRPYGMVLVTGPTGSGKSTTLYGLLAERNDPAINISTVEDPIEYSLGGINQTQVNREKGLDFNTALRAFMRQDPDVMLVGETRDLETAKTAIEAALTGHLVLTTLHCNDAVSAFARLDEMGVEPFLVSASLLGVVSQRLVRKLCDSCRIPYRPGEEELARFGLLASREAEITFYQARQTKSGPGACPHCRGNGYRGRVGVFEILVMNDQLSAAVARRATTDTLRRMAIENGLRSLLGYGLDLVRQGETTLKEIERILLTDTNLETERRARALSSLTCSGCGAGLEDEWLECPYCLTTTQAPPSHGSPD